MPLPLLTHLPLSFAGRQHAQHKQQRTLPLVRRRQHAKYSLTTSVAMQLAGAASTARLRHGKAAFIGLSPAPHYRQRKDICWYLRQCKAMSFPLLIISLFRSILALFQKKKNQKQFFRFLAFFLSFF